jgi:hypothetical protein
MGGQTIDIICMVIFFLATVGMWLYLGHMLFPAFCGNCCGQTSSRHCLDNTQAVFYVTKEASETTESHPEGQDSLIVPLLNDQYSV